MAEDAVTGDASRRERRDALVADGARLLAQPRSTERLERLDAIEQEYLATLPRPGVARCPHTAAPLELPIDSFGIDGPWWDYHNPRRVFEEHVPSCVAVTGALHLNAPPVPTSFLAVTGPELPFVVPRLLERPGMLAVISYLRVGPHDGYPISYFEEPAPRDIVRYNEWGADRYWFADASGVWGWDQTFEDTEVLDFELEPWLEAGKLRWIEPGDTGLQLRTGTEGFPYHGRDGRRGYVRVQDGRVWEPGSADEQALLHRLRSPLRGGALDRQQ